MRQRPRVCSIPPGVPFLDHLAMATMDGTLVPGWRLDGDPLRLADVTIFVPTRRAARALRSVFVERAPGAAAVLPTIRPLGDFDEDAAFFDETPPAALDLAPPIAAFDRILSLAPLVRAWTERLPEHLARLYDEPLLVPASLADAVWLARDLAELMDEVETEEAGWSALRGLVSDDLAGWWQVTLEFLRIVTASWPDMLAARDRSNPAAHRNALIAAEAERLAAAPPPGPVIAAGSTGSIPATARLLSVIARLPQGAVVLPGLDTALDEAAWALIGDAAADPSVFGHPQYGLKKLLDILGVARGEVVITGMQPPALAERASFVSEALRPAASTDRWTANRPLLDAAAASGALDGVTLVEAANERDEAAAIAVALRLAVEEEGRTAALVTGDRNLARRVSAELRRFGIAADDSGGTPLAATPPATLLRLALETAMRPGDPAALLALVKHPLLRLGLPRAAARRAAEILELVALRGGTARPDVADLAAFYERRLAELEDNPRKPFWHGRPDRAALDGVRFMLAALGEALLPLTRLRGAGAVPLDRLVAATVEAFEACGRGEEGGLADLYAGDAGTDLAAFLRALVAAGPAIEAEPGEWPDLLAALIAGETVKPSAGGDPRVFIWGALEARLQTVDTLVVGGLNEGSWPQSVEAGRFMSRMMKIGMELEPPERRIGLAAHDFQMAMGAGRVVLSRSARAGDAPAVASRWLQRLLTCAGEAQTARLRDRGETLLAWARALDEGPDIPFAARPQPAPALEFRPRHFSVTEIETLRRDPYAVYAKRILRLEPLDPLVRDPAAAERGILFHDILHRFTRDGFDPRSPDAAARLEAMARQCFAEAGLPDDIAAVWWPRFAAMMPGILDWEAERAPHILQRFAEVAAARTDIGDTGVTLSGRADRIDVIGGGSAEILDYKTGSTPSKRQAHILLAPQLALEGALLARGAFAGLGERVASDLVYVRLRPDGAVEPESILEYNRQLRAAPDLCAEAWTRLGELIAHFDREETGYLSRALPFRAEDVSGDYDHLARVLEWSAGGDADAGEAGLE